MDCIIFGCGDIGLATFNKVKDFFNVVAWSDNNKYLWGKTKNDVEIIEPNRISEYTDAIILIAVMNSSGIVEQLQTYGVNHLYVWKRGFFYSINGMYPLKVGALYYKCNKDDGNLDVLFISDTAYIRDHKMASLVKNKGHRAYLAYTVHSPQDMKSVFDNIYEEIFPIIDIDSMIEFIENSNFDIVHSSSNSEYITSLLHKTNKPIIHDCHDLRSAYRSLTANQIMIEWLAHRYSDGVIYPTSKLRDSAVRKLGVCPENTVVIENYISNDLVTDIRLDKLSEKDGMLHCVYEGGIEASTDSHKYFKGIWKSIAESGVHIHFYSQEVENICADIEAIHPNVHYEGNYSSKQLAVELSKYDVGLCVLNITPKNKLYLEASSPNKIQEYVNAGVPVAVGNIQTNIDFVENNRFGKYLDLNGDIYEQLKEIANIKIPINALVDLKFTFEDSGDKLIDFYKNVIANKEIL